MGMMDARTNDSLAALQLLKGLPPDALEDVRAAARIRRVPRNARLFNQGDGPVRAHALIDGYIRLKMEEVTRLRMNTHPVEFDMYYSL